MLEIGVLIGSVIINLSMGYVVYVKNPNSATNRLFLLLACSMAAWSSVNYFSLHPVIFSQIVWIRLVLFMAAFLCFSVFCAFTVFPDVVAEESRSKRRGALICTLIVMLLTLTPAVFRGLTIDAAGNASPQPNVGIVLFVGLVVGLLSGGIFSLILKYRQSEGVRRVQLKFILAGITGAFGLIVLTNLLFVLVFNNSSFIRFGAAFTLIFSGAFAYAIVRHRLFDIRRAAARGLAYVLTIGFLAALYSLAVFGLSSFLLNLSNIKEPQLVNTSLALLMAFSAQRTKHFFDKLSNRVFYKDAYDPQRLLNQLNQVLAGETNMNVMLRKCVDIMTSNFKTETCTFVIHATRFSAMRVIGNARSHEKATISELSDILSLARSHREKVIVADSLIESSGKLAQAMNDRDMAVVLKLLPGTGTGSGKDIIGEIVLSSKSNGDPYSRDDKKILEIICDELVIALQNALRFEEIERFNETLQQKVENATRQLRESNRKLKKLNDTKDDFIGMASHQLRTPLTSVKGYLSLVLDGDAGKISPVQRKLLQQAYTSSQRVIFLIADLLNVSRLNTGKFVIERIPTNLSKMIEDEISQLREAAAGRNITVEFEKPAHFPTLPLDEAKTRQVVMNFLDNAIYYGRNGGHIKIELHDLPQSVELRVVDDGIGVPKAEQHQLWTKFYRARNAQRARPDGTGLGLYMARKVVVAQGGGTIFDSVEGKGSTFGFTFPKDMPLESVATPVAR